MEKLLKDLRFALRRMRRTPGFTAVAVLSLSVGIGANTAIFSLVDQFVLRRPPVPDPARVVDVSFNDPAHSYIPFSYPDLQDFRRAMTGVYSQVSATELTVAPRDLGDHVTTVPVEMVNGEYFPLLELKPAVGRLLGPGDVGAAGGNPVVVLSYAYWQSAFSGDPNVVGTQIRLTGQPFTVVGVAPASYTGAIRGVSPSVYAPITMINQIEATGTDLLQARGSHSIFVRARLAPGVGAAQATSRGTAFIAQEVHDHPDEWTPNETIRLVPLTQVAVNPAIDGAVKSASVLLMGLVGLVLLIACANLASFLLAQARDRQREIAVRLALGAGPGAMVRQLLTETVTLAAVGGVGGVLLAQLLLHALLTADLPVPLPLTLSAPLDGRVLAFAASASVVAGLLFGLAPALRAARTDVVGTIKSENMGGGPRRRLTLYNGLVVGQVAVSVVLLVVAGLFVRSLLAEQAVAPGFGERPALVATLLIPANRYPGEKAAAFLDRVETRLQRVPGVVAAGATSNLQLNPLSRNETGITVPGIQPPPGQQSIPVDYARIDTAFFAAAGIPLVQGRDFTWSEVHDTAAVAIVSQTMARRFWPGRDAVGETFSRNGRTFDIVGVARDTKVRKLSEAPLPFLYLPMSPAAATQPMLVVSTRGDAQAMVTPLLRTLKELDPDVPVFHPQTMASYLATLVLPVRLGALAISAFAILAMGLALLGVYGVVRYAVARRMREAAIRMSVGAEPGNLVGLLAGRGILLVLVGDVVGLVLGLAGSRVLGSFLFGINPLDPVTFATVPVLLAGVGLLASYLPARRAARLDPSTLLRRE